MQARVRDTTALASGSVLSGLLAYVFFALSTRALGAAGAAPVSVLWTYWSFAAAALTFPLQHWITRSVAAHDGEAAVHHALPRVAMLVVVASGAAGLLAWMARDALFHRDDAWFPLLVGCVTLGSGLIGVVRGGLSARHRFRGVASVLVAENASRCVAAAVLMIAHVRASLGYGICLAAGSLVGLLWPSSFRFATHRGRSAAESSFRFLGGAAGGQLIGQAVLTGGPVLLALSGGTAVQVTALFAALALFRAPYMVAVAVVSTLTGRLTTLLVQDNHAALRRVRVSVLAGAAAAASMAGGLGAVAGPGLLRLIFGNEVRLDWFLSMLVAIGSAFALANLVMTIMIMAQGGSGKLARAWVVGVLGGVLVWVLSAQEPLMRTCWAFLAAEAVAFAALTVEEVRGSARHSSRDARNRGATPLYEAS